MLSIQPSDLCTDQEFVRRAYLDLCGVLPTPDEVQGVPGRQGPGQAGQADRRPARAAGVRRLLDAEMGRRAAQQPQDDPGQGHARLPAVAARPHRRRTRRFDEVVRELLTASGSTFANPPANYYRIARDPHEPGRDDGPAVLRHPHAVRQVPQPSVRALDAGRLLQHGGVLRPGEAEEGHAASRAPTRRRPAASSSTPTAPAR